MQEELYNKFITDFLPQVQEGLVITKDYFFDLFGRYVKYLIVIDSLWMLFSVVLFIFLLILFKKNMKKWDEDYECIEALLLLLLVPIVIFMISINCLIKDIYIPEIRIIEKISNLNNQ